MVLYFTVIYIIIKIIDKLIWAYIGDAFTFILFLLII